VKFRSTAQSSVRLVLDRWNLMSRFLSNVAVWLVDGDTCGPQAVVLEARRISASTAYVRTPYSQSRVEDDPGLEGMA